MKNNLKQAYLSRKGLKSYLKTLRRKRKEDKRRSGYLKFVLDVYTYAKREGTSKTVIIQPLPKKNVYTAKRKRPKRSDLVKFLASIPQAFTSNAHPRIDGSNFEIPKIFSLTDNYKESFSFLKKLFYALYKEKTDELIIDYKNCQRIDVDASVCMDILLREFVSYIKQCRVGGHSIKPNSIKPINFNRPEIAKILFSIGAFRNVAGVKIKFEDIEPYELCIGDKKDKFAPQKREVHITELVDYIVRCTNRMNRKLTPEAEDNLYKVIGEVMINAEEHSTTDNRYSIGYFQETQSELGNVGVFNLVIFNFGKTIYENFSDPSCPNQDVVTRMKELSAQYTKNNLFKSAEFEEETLWTLYALQEGVTSKKDWKRGNGSIRFIESFFNLKGDSNIDNLSRLTIVSGFTQIIFDGTHRITEKPRGKGQKMYKMMTFNTSGEIEEQPDSKFVTFVKNYFPGTLIAAKICIKYNNTEDKNL